MPWPNLAMLRARQRSADQHGSSASMNDRGGENANSSATHGGDDDLEKGQRELLHFARTVTLY